MALLRLNENQQGLYKIYSNIGIGVDSFNTAINRLIIKSQHTNDILFDLGINWFDGNERYAVYEILNSSIFGTNIYDFDLQKDIDGIYNYGLQFVEFEEDEEGNIIFNYIETFDSGLMKIEVVRFNVDKDKEQIGYF